jgi:hypothetical protein
MKISIAEQVSMQRLLTFYIFKTLAVRIQSNATCIVAAGFDAFPVCVFTCFLILDSC